MKNLKCNFCKKGNFSTLYKGYKVQNKEFNVEICNNCGLVCTNPQPSEKEILSYYIQDYYGTNNFKFNGLIEKFVRFKRKVRADRVEKFAKPGRVLDIGCGRGIFLSNMRARGYETYGVELSETAAKYAKRTAKLNVLIGQLEKIKFADKFFDVIILYHVLEHFSNPSQKLKEVQRILKRGGLLVIAVPNIQSLQAKIFKIFWFHLDIPRHYFHFCLQTLNKMLPSKSWKILKIKRFSLEYGPFGWIQSSLNVLFGNNNILYDILKKKSSDALTIYTPIKFRRLITVINLFLGILLIVPATMLSLILSLTNFSEMVEIYYQKE